MGWLQRLLSPSHTIYIRANHFRPDLGIDQSDRGLPTAIRDHFKTDVVYCSHNFCRVDDRLYEYPYYSMDKHLEDYTNASIHRYDDTIVREIKLTPL